MSTPNSPLLIGLLALLLVVAVLAAAVWWWRARVPKKDALPLEWELNPRPVFNSDERRIYRHLRDALPQHIVLCKLPLVRFSQAADPKRVRYWYELLSSASVAFAVCSPNGRVLLAIDLEGEGVTSRRSMQIKHAALAACKVRYLRCSVERLPSVPELRRLVPAVPQPAANGPAGLEVLEDRHPNLNNAYASGPMPLDPLVPHAHQSHDPSASTIASRRRERGALWQDSGFMHDSFYVTHGDGHPASPTTTSSDFGSLSRNHGSRVLGGLPDDVGGIVIDTPVSPLRH